MIRKTLDISIVVANYNNAPYLNDFFNSILSSSILPKELIIIDDGSTDNSIEIIESYLSNDFIRLIKFDTNKGFANALNKGIQESTGKYIARIDPDDIMLEDRLDTQFNFLEQNPHIDLVGGNVTYFNSLTQANISNSNFPENHDAILKAYKSGDHGVQHPTVFAKAELFKRYSYNQDTYPAEDYDIFARMIIDGYVFANIQEPVNKMRVHSNSVSNSIAYKTIEKTFSLRDKIFNIKQSDFQVKRYYKYISNYRKFLFAQSLLIKLFYILAASFYYPEKVINKIFSDKKISIQLSYYTFLVLFLTDSIVNFFVRAPIFVSGGLVLLFYNFELLRRYKQFDKKLIILVLSFILIGIANNIIYHFHIKNISDLFFILLFFTSYYLYKNNPQTLTKQMVWIFLYACLILLIPSFFGISKWKSTIELYSNDIEFLRKYNQGFFRIPHIGSYFFGFLSLFFAYQYSLLKKYIYLGAALITISLCFYIGVRTFFVASILATLIFLITGKYWKILTILFLLMLLLIIFIDPLLEVTKRTFVFQYLSFIKTSLSNFSRLSRILIWSSWLTEMNGFHWYDYVFGKTFIASHYANESNIVGHPKGLWFHNDFFSIIYSYGLWAISLYIYFIIKIFNDFKVLIINNVLIFIYYFTMIFSAFFNGFYYYFPVFLLVPFIYMLNQQTKSNNI